MVETRIEALGRIADRGEIVEHRRAAAIVTSTRRARRRASTSSSAQTWPSVSRSLADTACQATRASVAFGCSTLRSSSARSAVALGLAQAPRGAAPARAARAWPRRTDHEGVGGDHAAHTRLLRARARAPGIRSASAVVPAQPRCGGAHARLNFRPHSPRTPVTAPLWQLPASACSPRLRRAFARAPPEPAARLSDPRLRRPPPLLARRPRSVSGARLWRFAGVRGGGEDGPVLRERAGACPALALWFPQARAETSPREPRLRRLSDATPALIAWSGGAARAASSRTRAELTAHGSRLAQALAELGRRARRPGHRRPALPERSGGAAVAMLASASLGAIWTSCSPDFGARGRRRPLRTDRAARAVRDGRLRATWASASIASRA